MGAVCWLRVQVEEAREDGSCVVVVVRRATAEDAAEGFSGPVVGTRLEALVSDLGGPAPGAQVGVSQPRARGVAEVRGPAAGAILRLPPPNGKPRP